ncbi:MAG: hypothetical protein ACYCOU_07265 [Sulfobacillus sp.]
MSRRTQWQELLRKMHEESGKVRPMSFYSEEYRKTHTVKPRGPKSACTKLTVDTCNTNPECTVRRPADYFSKFYGKQVHRNESCVKKGVGIADRSIAHWTNVAKEQGVYDDILSKFGITAEQAGGARQRSACTGYTFEECSAHEDEGCVGRRGTSYTNKFNTPVKRRSSCVHRPNPEAIEAAKKRLMEYSVLRGVVERNPQILRNHPDLADRYPSFKRMLQRGGADEDEDYEY